MWVKESRMADRNVLKGHTTWSDYISMVPSVFVKPYSKSFTLNEAWITTQSVRRVCFGLAKPSILHAGLFGREVSELLHVETHSWSAWGDTDGWATEALSVHELLLQSFHTTLPLVHILVLFNPLSPCESPDFYLHYFTLLCVLKVGFRAII